MDFEQLMRCCTRSLKMREKKKFRRFKKTKNNESIHELDYYFVRRLSSCRRTHPVSETAIFWYIFPPFPALHNHICICAQPLILHLSRTIFSASRLIIGPTGNSTLPLSSLKLVRLSSFCSFKIKFNTKC